MQENNYCSIFNVTIFKSDSKNLLEYVKSNIKKEKKFYITYTNANSLNLIYKCPNLLSLFNNFDHLHPDGLGVYLASKFLYGKNGFKNRFTGSDFYPSIINEGIKNKWKFFLFGDSEKTLSEAVKKNNTLNICGYQNGYDFEDEKLIKKINNLSPDILIVGLGCPKQEEWISKFKDQINTKIILAVGDGIKVFAGTKTRGIKFLQKLGLEWFVRLITNPQKYWRRYLLGIPLFIIRVIKYKLSAKV